MYCSIHFFFFVDTLRCNNVFYTLMYTLLYQFKSLTTRPITATTFLLTSPQSLLYIDISIEILKRTVQFDSAIH